MNLIAGFADQTRMLAFKVSVEAGRDGGEGQVINVIAREVHALVQQSENAAKEIRHLVDWHSSRNQRSSDGDGIQ